MPVRPMTDEEAERIFGSGRVLFGQKRPQPSGESSKQKESSLPAEPEKKQPPKKGE